MGRSWSTGRPRTARRNRCCSRRNRAAGKAAASRVACFRIVLRLGRGIALYYPLNPKYEVISMSAIHATGAEIHNASANGGTPEAELAHKCLYYMLLMREVEDRIERKLYRQG